MSDLKMTRVWKLGILTTERVFRKRFKRDLIVHFYWDIEQLFSIRFGRHGRRLFSERNQHLPSIQNRWHYFLGKRVTIITPRREGTK